ncbi:hypothetical protein JGK44_000039 [Shewanella algae]|uniref:hypothetical protein n=1 Tax=Shewanella algae TaxID=38313 RepID=UPI001AAEE94E|nr:hypothetical protein [Shewanella algae]EKT4485668.1 hypothetical protein [Shewanella algae]MBO2586862.1 hypothetical protein [Shewanella algae]
MSILQQFYERREEAEANASLYEQCNNLEMAYLALWSVTEHTAKDVESMRLRRELKKKVRQWAEYLDGTGTAPPPIKSFSLGTQSIPPIANLKSVLGEIPAVSKLLQTKAKGKSSKYRDKRNAIAHHAERFTDKTRYDDYKSTAQAAIDELAQKLKDIQ